MLLIEQLNLLSVQTKVLHCFVKVSVTMSSVNFFLVLTNTLYITDIEMKGLLSISTIV